MEGWIAGLLFGIAIVGAVQANDVAGTQAPELLSRLPGQEIRWQQVEDHGQFQIPVGSVTGSRQMHDWIDVEGRITRTFYRYTGTDRTYAEFYLNYLQTLKSRGFEILGEGISGDRRGVGVGSRVWSEVYFHVNAITKPGEADEFLADTSYSGGAAAIVARRQGAAGTVYVVIGVEQHADDYVGALVDIVEVRNSDEAPVAIDAKLIDANIREYGRVILKGIVFTPDKPTLEPESDPALKATADYLAAHRGKAFYVVGHGNPGGPYSASVELSSARATAVVHALEARFGVAAEQLEAHGVGPLSPVVSDDRESARDQNERVELVAR